MRKIITKLLGWKSENTYYDWKKQNRPIINLLEEYFNKEELQEYIDTGRITRLEEKTIVNTKIDVYENIMMDNAIYSAKNKYIRLFDDGFFNLARPAKGILYDVIESIEKNDESYTLENSKQRLIDQIKALKLKWYDLKAKNPQKQELLYRVIEECFSKVEVYVMIKHREDIF